VAKQAVLDNEINDDRTLHKDVCDNFKAQNSGPDLDCAAHMARWITIFGATDAYCAK